MDSSAAIPLYKQLKEILKNSILRGELHPNQKLPSEPQLSEIYHVSRITVRSAINELVQEKMLTKVRGKGTFVNFTKLERDMTKVLSFTDVCRISNVKPGSLVKTCEVVDSTPDDVKLLGITLGEKIIHLCRVRLADDTPVILEDVRLPGKYSELLLEDFKNGSLYQFLREKYGVTFYTSRKSVEIEFADRYQSQELNVAEGYPLLLICGVAYDEAGIPIHSSVQHIVGDKFKLLI